jgi:hypothetical protein
MTARGSICIGCGCTDRFACEGGCSWLVNDGRVGVCSCCSRALPAWERGARLAYWVPETPPFQQLRMWVGDVAVKAYRPGTNQPRGPYAVPDDERWTVRLVDERGLPYVAPLEAVHAEYSTDWGEVAKAKSASLPRGGRRSDAADAKRGQQLKTERGRQRAKAAKKARQATRRRS